jgi:hypothetical protein
VAVAELHRRVVMLVPVDQQDDAWSSAASKHGSLAPYIA